MGLGVQGFRVGWCMVEDLGFGGLGFRVRGFRPCGV